MRTARRRQRRPDPLASPEAVRAVLASLKSAMPNEIPDGERKVISLLRAARHVQRYPATDTRRGRRGKFNRELLIKVASRLGDILGRETSSKAVFASFVDHYLRLLSFPPDVLEALVKGDINLTEASQLARLTKERLGVSSADARRRRQSILSAHLASHSSVTSLRLRVNELLTPPAEVSNGEGATAVSAEEELELLDEFDPSHLFWDQIKQLLIALRSIQPGDVEDEEIDELLKTSEPVLNVLAKIQRRKERRASKFKV